jgi:hypothetical protein
MNTTQDQLDALNNTCYCTECCANGHCACDVCNEPCECAFCPECGDEMDERHDNLRPTWSDEHDNIVCGWCWTNGKVREVMWIKP